MHGIKFLEATSILSIVIRIHFASRKAFSSISIATAVDRVCRTLFSNAE